MRLYKKIHVKHLSYLSFIGIFRIYLENSYGKGKQKSTQMNSINEGNYFHYTYYFRMVKRVEL